MGSSMGKITNLCKKREMLKIRWKSCGKPRNRFSFFAFFREGLVVLGTVVYCRCVTVTAASERTRSVLTLRKRTVVTSTPPFFLSQTQAELAAGECAPHENVEAPAAARHCPHQSAPPPLAPVTGSEPGTPPYGRKKQNDSAGRWDAACGTP